MDVAWRKGAPDGVSSTVYVDGVWYNVRTSGVAEEKEFQSAGVIGEFV
jgi:hypothetical protein